MSKIAFTGARLIDGTGAKPVDNSLLLVEGKKIAAVKERGHAVYNHH